jgi:hypothetical protein
MIPVLLLKSVLVFFHTVTADVQDVTICQVNIATYIISCVFLSGSDASGCNYTLMSEEGSITGSIERSNSEGETIVVAGTAAGSELILQAYAHDLTLDNTTSGLVITRSIARWTRSEIMLYWHNRYSAWTFQHKIH